jgi:O-antigen biosynthesis protein
LHFIKKKLQENLSISAKLSLRTVVARSKGALLFVTGLPVRLAQRTVEIISGRRLQLPGNLAGKSHSSAPLSLAENISADATRLLLTKSRKELTAPGEIRVSIVIPVFNKAEFTLNCLHSLLHEIDLRGTEIIVVNNASTDRTAEILAQFSDLVRVISNEENRGFVDACNQGAAVARGKFLVFLNNDTEVLPGWLNNLEETAEQSPSVGAVGSLFLYPDGSIQEAGAIVWRNGEAHHYGCGASADDRRFNFAREVDYSSAASLLIRKDLFDRLGGFDRRFAPAYYEDVDLCFGVRSLSYKVMYQPASRLVHYEGVTAGADTSKGIKQFQISNREKFVTKWHEVLEREQLPKDLKRLTEASKRNRDWPRIIVFDERIPTPDRDAGSLRMFLILKTLAKWSHVIFVPINRPKDLDYERALWKEGIETADAVDYRRLLRNENVKTALVSRPGPAAALIHRIRRANPRVRVLFDMVDTHFVRLQREYEVSSNAHARTEAQRYRKLERRLARASDLVWCASPEDKEVMKREVPGCRIEVVPTIHELHDCGKPFADREGLLFIGNLAHRPNEDAILFFIREIFPRIRQAFPNMQLDIIGDNPSLEISAFNSETVRIEGYVPDVEPYLRERRVFVAPLRFGAGIKGKIGESMSYGLPVVTTTMGAEGFGLVHEHNAMIADTPEDFAAAVARLYSEKELWQTLAANSHRHIEQNFTPQVISKTIDSSIKATV